MYVYVHFSTYLQNKYVFKVFILRSIENWAFLYKIFEIRHYLNPEKLSIISLPMISLLLQ